MEKITQEELDKIIEKHELWLKGEDGGEKADLSNKNLSFMDLNEVNLSGADLCGANFCNADVCDANLYGANLSNTNLFSACFLGSNLCRANLAGADLHKACLGGVNLTDADICQTNFHKANLVGANLNGVITDGDTQGFYLVCPEEGSFIGWKKAKTIAEEYALVKLLIPEDAKRSSATTRKCRASKAKVLEITIIETGKVVNTAYGYLYSDLEYRTGEYVYPDSFDEDRWIECTNGIHFFMTKDEAIDY